MRRRVDFLTYYSSEDGIHPQLKAACEWAEKSIFNDIEVGAFETPVTLAGGALRSFFFNTPVHDYDLYVPAGFEGVEAGLRDNTYYETSDTKRSKMMTHRPMVSLKNPDEPLIPAKNANLIKQTYSTAASVIDSFDFTVCMCAVTKEDDSLYITYHPDFFVDLLSKKLRVHNPENALNTIWRVQKYTQMGFTIDREDLWKIVEDIHDLQSLPKVGYGGDETFVDRAVSPAVPLESIFGGS